jgi:hypothetical protein
MLDTIDEGLSDSQLLKARGREEGMLSEGTEGRCRGAEAALEYWGSGKLVDDTTLLVMRRSSTVLSADTDETCSNDLSAEPPSAATISASETPRSRSNERSFLFSSSTFLAAPWISADVSIPTCSQLRNLASSSCRYSLRRARERPVHECQYVD